MTPPIMACHKPYMQNFNRRQNEQIQFLHEAISFDLLNLTLSYGETKGYFISNKQKKYQTSKVGKKKMPQSFCNLRDATENCPNLVSGISYCRPNCAK